MTLMMTPGLRFTGMLELVQYSVEKLHEATEISVMADYVRQL